MSTEIVEPNESNTEVSRRTFLRKSTGVVAGMAGIFGLSKVGDFASKPTTQASGYGSSPYGGKKD